MISLPCPHCGARDAAEFAYIDESTVRPDATNTTPPEWRAYLYQRQNPAGWAEELWLHRAGCGRYLSVTRHRVTGAVSTVRDSAGVPGRRREEMSTTGDADAIGTAAG